MSSFGQKPAGLGPRVLAVLKGASRFGAAAVVVVASAGIEGHFGARAQDAAAQPAVRVSRVILAEPERDTPLAIQIVSGPALPNQTFIRLRGLPPTAKLSEGHMVAPGAWAVPLAALSTLKVRTPVAGSGRAEISVALVTIGGEVLAETRTALVVAPAWLLGADGKPAAERRPAPAAAPAATPAAPQPAPKAAAKPERTAALTPAPKVAATQRPVTADLSAPPNLATSSGLLRTTPPPPPAAAPAPLAQAAPAAPVAKLTAADRARAQQLIDRGDKFLEQGNIAAARQFFLRAADMGHSGGAMKMASTYDPAELAKLPIAGLTPSFDEARKWYERARKLGAGEAADRLSRLSAAR